MVVGQPMKNKWKIGELVKVVGEKDGLWVKPEFLLLVGQLGIVIDVNKSAVQPYLLHLQCGKKLWFVEDDIERVK